MKEVQATVTITIKEEGNTLTEVEKTASISINTQNMESDAAAGYTIYSDDDPEISEEEAERHAVVSDLADVCDYLEEKEVIKIKLIIRKAQERKERDGKR